MSFTINRYADLIQKEIRFLGDRGGFSTLVSILLPNNWCEWKTKKGGNNKAEFGTHFKLRENVNTFWAPINSGATAHLDLEALRAILLTGIFGAYVMEEPHMVHDFFTFTIAQSGEIEGAQPNLLIDNVNIILKWCVMSGQVDNQGNSLLNIKIESIISVCGEFSW